MTSIFPSIQEASRPLAHSRDEFSEEVIGAYRECRWSELALRRHGWTPERLQKAAHRAVADYAAGIPYLSPERREDLFLFVQEKALDAVTKFRPAHPITTYGANGGTHFDSWILDIMMKRCLDWHRSKAEGNGDRRYGNDNRIVLADDPDPADHDTDFEYLVDERRRARWQQAANTVQWSLSEWIVITLDRAASDVARSAA